MAEATANSITFRDVSECIAADLGRVVHIKGFGLRIAFEDEETASWGDCAVSAVSELKPDTLVWDGDSFHADSFTALVPRIWRSCAPRLVMFLRDKEKDRKRVQESWPSVPFIGEANEDSSQNIDCFLLQADIKFDRLGQLALQATQAKDVIAVGGGPVVWNEFAAGSTDVTYGLVPLKRRTADGEGWESCALENLEAPNLKILHLDIEDPEAPSLKLLKTTETAPGVIDASTLECTLKVFRDRDPNETGLIHRRVLAYLLQGLPARPEQIDTLLNTVGKPDSDYISYEEFLKFLWQLDVM